MGFVLALRGDSEQTSDDGSRNLVRIFGDEIDDACSFPERRRELFDDGPDRRLASGDSARRENRRNPLSRLARGSRLCRDEGRFCHPTSGSGLSRCDVALEVSRVGRDPWIGEEHSNIVVTGDEPGFDSRNPMDGISLPQFADDIRRILRCTSEKRRTATVRGRKQRSWNWHASFIGRDDKGVERARLSGAGQPQQGSWRPAGSSKSDHRFVGRIEEWLALLCVGLATASRNYRQRLEAAENAGVIPT